MTQDTAKYAVVIDGDGFDDTWYGWVCLDLETGLVAVWDDGYPDHVGIEQVYDDETFAKFMLEHFDDWTPEGNSSNALDF